MGSDLLGRFRYVAEQIPNEADELPGHSDVHLGLHNAASEPVPPSLVQTRLSHPGELPIDSGLAFLTNADLSGHPRRHERMLHGLDQNPSGVGVAEKLGQTALLRLA